MRRGWLYLFVVAIFAVVAQAHAQGGCVDSPECPTAVLGAVGLAAGAAARLLRRR